MTEEQYEALYQSLLAALHAAAENEAVLNNILEDIQEMQDDDCSYDFIIKSMVGILYDGLRYGNWRM